MNNHKDIIKLETTASTNKYAQTFLQNNAVNDFTVIATETQTAGKGQINNVWESDPCKNLTFSIVLYPQIAPMQQFIISQLVSLGIVDYFEAHGVEAKIKWPNDIYIENCKIAGILIENTLFGNSIKHSIIGIGLNVNQTVFVSAPNPTSLKIETGRTFIIDEELISVCAKIKNRYSELAHIEKDMVTTEYLSKLFLYRVYSTYKDLNNDVFIGRIIGVNEIGKLLLETKAGIIRTFAFKELQFVGE